MIKLYRYTQGNVLNSEFGFPDISKPILSEFEVITETDKGYWIKPYKKDDGITFTSGVYFFNKKWVPKEGVNLFAFTEKNKAMFNLKKRTEKRIKILQRQMLLSKMTLRMVENESV
ncbi:hypothetical protein [Flammeovirga agarivorans]|uniref:Uncharacterized protein n=1 Tax=Flammeovirga agarivorans TaxID=2726742 RepID=A0A7X8SRA1_9BACT|nr:hypothetical protein [Flammeovirga agarivorans]NLR94946.1 hypothetical protein [Flammeovirga agarivorans]